MQDIVIIGAGPAGRAAAEVAPDARVIARPDATAWHAEPGRLWIETASGVSAIPFSHLVLCADEPLLLMALGCDFAHGRPVVDETGKTSVPGAYAAGRILGAASADEAAYQGRVAAGAVIGVPIAPGISVRPAGIDTPPATRLDPLELAQLLERPPGPERSAAALAQAQARGPRLSGTVGPARPVGFAVLAAIAPATLDPRPVQDAVG